MGLFSSPYPERALAYGSGMIDPIRAKDPGLVNEMSVEELQKVWCSLTNASMTTTLPAHVKGDCTDLILGDDTKFIDTCFYCVTTWEFSSPYPERALAYGSGMIDRIRAKDPGLFSSPYPERALAYGSGMIDPIRAKDPGLVNEMSVEELQKVWCSLTNASMTTTLPAHVKGDCTDLILGDDTKFIDICFYRVTAREFSSPYLEKALAYWSVMINPIRAKDPGLVNEMSVEELQKVWCSLTNASMTTTLPAHVKGDCTDLILGDDTKFIDTCFYRVTAREFSSPYPERALAYGSGMIDPIRAKDPGLVNEMSVEELQKIWCSLTYASMTTTLPAHVKGDCTDLILGDDTKFIDTCFYRVTAREFSSPYPERALAYGSGMIDPIRAKDPGLVNEMSVEELQKVWCSLTNASMTTTLSAHVKGDCTDLSLGDDTKFIDTCFYRVTTREFSSPYPERALAYGSGMNDPIRAKDPGLVNKILILGDDTKFIDTCIYRVTAREFSSPYPERALAYGSGMIDPTRAKDPGLFSSPYPERALAYGSCMIDPIRAKDPGLVNEMAHVKGDCTDLILGDDTKFIDTCFYRVTAREFSSPYPERALDYWSGMIDPIRAKDPGLVNEMSVEELQKVWCSLTNASMTTTLPAHVKGDCTDLILGDDTKFIDTCFYRVTAREFSSPYLERALANWSAREFSSPYPERALDYWSGMIDPIRAKDPGLVNEILDLGRDTKFIDTCFYRVTAREFSSPYPERALAYGSGMIDPIRAKDPRLVNEMAHVKGDCTDLILGDDTKFIDTCFYRVTAREFSSPYPERALDYRSGMIDPIWAKDPGLVNEMAHVKGDCTDLILGDDTKFIDTCFYCVTTWEFSSPYPERALAYGSGMIDRIRAKDPGLVNEMSVEELQKIWCSLTYASMTTTLPAHVKGDCTDLILGDDTKFIDTCFYRVTAREFSSPYPERALAYGSGMIDPIRAKDPGLVNEMAHVKGDCTDLSLGDDTKFIDTCFYRVTTREFSSPYPERALAYGSGMNDPIRAKDPGLVNKILILGDDTKFIDTCIYRVTAREFSSPYPERALAYGSGMIDPIRAKDPGLFSSPYPERALAYGSCMIDPIRAKDPGLVNEMAHVKGDCTDLILGDDTKFIDTCFYRVTAREFSSPYPERALDYWSGMIDPIRAKDPGLVNEMSVEELQKVWCSLTNASMTTTLPAHVKGDCTDLILGDDTKFIDTCFYRVTAREFSSPYLERALANWSAREFSSPYPERALDYWSGMIDPIRAKDPGLVNEILDLGRDTKFIDTCFYRVTAREFSSPYPERALAYGSGMIDPIRAKDPRLVNEMAHVKGDCTDLILGDDTKFIDTCFYRVTAREFSSPYPERALDYRSAREFSSPYPERALGYGSGMIDPIRAKDPGLVNEMSVEELQKVWCSLTNASMTTTLPAHVKGDCTDLILGDDTKFIDTCFYRVTALEFSSPYPERALAYGSGMIDPIRAKDPGLVNEMSVEELQKVWCSLTNASMTMTLPAHVNGDFTDLILGDDTKFIYTCFYRVTAREFSSPYPERALDYWSGMIDPIRAKDPGLVNEMSVEELQKVWCSLTNASMTTTLPLDLGRDTKFIDTCFYRVTAREFSSPYPERELAYGSGMIDPIRAKDPGLVNEMSVEELQKVWCSLTNASMTTTLPAHVKGDCTDLILGDDTKFIDTCFYRVTSREFSSPYLERALAYWSGMIDPIRAKDPRLVNEMSVEELQAHVKGDCTDLILGDDTKFIDTCFYRVTAREFSSPYLERALANWSAREFSSPYPERALDYWSGMIDPIRAKDPGLVNEMSVEELQKVWCSLTNASMTTTLPLDLGRDTKFIDTCFYRVTAREFSSPYPERELAYGSGMIDPIRAKDPGLVNEMSVEELQKVWCSLTNASMTTTLPAHVKGDCTDLILGDDTKFIDTCFYRVTALEFSSPYPERALAYGSGMIDPIRAKDPGLVNEMAHVNGDFTDLILGDDTKFIDTCFYRVTAREFSSSYLERALAYWSGMIDPIRAKDPRLVNEMSVEELQKVWCSLTNASMTTTLPLDLGRDTKFIDTCFYRVTAREFSSPYPERELAYGSGMIDPIRAKDPGLVNEMSVEELQKVWCSLTNASMTTTLPAHVKGDCTDLILGDDTKFIDTCFYRVTSREFSSPYLERALAYWSGMIDPIRAKDPRLVNEMSVEELQAHVKGDCTDLILGDDTKFIDTCFYRVTAREFSSPYLERALANWSAREFSSPYPERALDYWSGMIDPIRAKDPGLVNEMSVEELQKVWCSLPNASMTTTLPLDLGRDTKFIDTCFYRVTAREFSSPYPERELAYGSGMIDPIRAKDPGLVNEMSVEELQKVWCSLTNASMTTTLPAHVKGDCTDLILGDDTKVIDTCFYRVTAREFSSPYPERALAYGSGMMDPIRAKDPGLVNEMSVEELQKVWCSLTNASMTTTLPAHVNGDFTDLILGDDTKFIDTCFYRVTAREFSSSYLERALAYWSGMIDPIRAKDPRLVNEMSVEELQKVWCSLTNASMTTTLPLDLGRDTKFIDTCFYRVTAREFSSPYPERELAYGSGMIDPIRAKDPGLVNEMSVEELQKVWCSLTNASMTTTLPAHVKGDCTDLILGDDTKFIDTCFYRVTAREFSSPYLERALANWSAREFISPYLERALAYESGMIDPIRAKDPGLVNEMSVEELQKVWCSLTNASMTTTLPSPYPERALAYGSGMMDPIRAKDPGLVNEMSVEELQKVWAHVKGDCTDLILGDDTKFIDTCFYRITAREFSSPYPERALAYGSGMIDPIRAKDPGLVNEMSVEELQKVWCSLTNASMTTTLL
ncbi:hypothetical protein QVD17_30315 [Tagetes erecta]|uniref:Uncharacterized protein n=1 Tax=Tagetes erecta TaxID=13708 RepID=A0AAD8K2H3_TARER|nr:hypothetical protein QVD17_30315 [Tagetes erecta]